MAYISEFKDADNNAVKIQIETASNTPDVEVLTLYDAMTVEYNGESVFDSLKPSRASINLLLSDIKPDLFTGSLNGVKVKLFKNNSLFWFGFVTPNIYTHSYSHVYDKLTLECVDVIAQLDNIDYRYISRNDSVGIFSFFDILTHCLGLADTTHVITHIYADSSITTASGEGPILNNLYIKERNFFDEKEEAMKCKEVVSSLLQYLGLTGLQYKDAYYIYSPAKVNSAYTFTHYIYSGSGWQQTADVTLNLVTRTTAQLGQSGDDVTVSLNGVYNKVTVVANNNPLDNILPDFDDSEDLINQNADPNHYEVEDYTAPDSTQYKLVSAFFKSQNNWLYSRPTTENSLLPSTYITEVTTANRDSITSGIWWTKCDDYKVEDGEPSSLSWKSYITMVGGGLYAATPFLTLHRAQTMILDGGYLVVNVSYKFSTDYRPHTAVKSMYDLAETYGSCSALTWTSNSDNIGYDNWPDNTMFIAKINIGNYYFDGDNWVSYDVFHAKESRGYYTMSSSNIHGYALQGGPGTTHKVGDWQNWYRYVNEYGDWIYCTRAQYEAHTGTKKETGKTKRNNHFYFIDGNGDHVQMNIDYYYEIMLRDRFYLVHINKVNETIYDTEYSLTNTVSYRMNIVDSSDGVAIKCPDDMTLYGTLDFTLYPPDKLGNNPQPRTDMASTTLRAIHLTGLSIKYSKTTANSNIFGANTDPDTIYSNKIDESYCKELEDIELHVNTQNSWATSYSYVIERSGSDYKYIDGLTFGTVRQKPEERLVERLVNYHQSPKYQFKRAIHNNTYEVTPFAAISERIGGVSKTMVTTAAAYNISANTVEITTNEI